MNQYKINEYSKAVYYRLIALWVICEAFAGGIMHAAKLPFTGLIVSSLAITCIILIAYYVPSKSAILKATIIVAIFKLMLSPHSPPTAYLAVFFQGLMGQLLLSNRKYFNAGAIILAILSLVESAVQRILVLVIFSGTAFWKAVNEFIKKTVGAKELTDYSFKLAIGYIIIHALIGIFVGIYATKLARSSERWKGRYPGLLIEKENSVSAIVMKKNNHSRKIKLLSAFILAALVALYIQSFLYPKHTMIPPNIIVTILLRSVIILLVWYLILGPVVMFLIKKILRAQQEKYKNDINEVMKLLPQVKHIFKQSFKLSESKEGFSRIKLFFKILLINILIE